MGLSFKQLTFSIIMDNWKKAFMKSIREVLTLVCSITISMLKFSFELKSQYNIHVNFLIQNDDFEDIEGCPCLSDLLMEVFVDL